MRRLVLALVGTFALGLGAPVRVVADISPLQTTQVTLSCSDGHSVIVWVDPTALASLTADIQAINTSGTALSCLLDTASLDPSTATADWTVYDYNPSGSAIAPRNSPSSMPATTSGNTTSFQFKPAIYTALLTTTDRSLTGDLSTKTLSDSVTVSGNQPGPFQYQNGDGCVYPANARFYFTAPSASGSSYPPPGPPINGLPPAGFYTHFWWSNPANVPLLSGNQGPTLISANMFDPSEWSDWDGQRGDSSPAVTEAFLEAIHNVQSVGLSFGGGCFFENGVTVTDSYTETFTSTFAE